MTVSVTDPDSVEVLEGLTVDVVLWELLAETERLADPDSLAVPSPDGLTEAERVSFVGEAVYDARVEKDGEPDRVSWLAEGVTVVERAGLIVCVSVSKRVRVEVRVTRSVGDGLAETQREGGGVLL